MSLLELECKGISAKAVFHIHVCVTIFDLGCKRFLKPVIQQKANKAKAD